MPDALYTLPVLAEIQPLTPAPIPHAYRRRCQVDERCHESTFYSLTLCLPQQEHIYFSISQSLSHSVAGCAKGHWI